MPEEAGTPPPPEPVPPPSTYVVTNPQTQEAEVWTSAEVEQEQRFQEAMARAPQPILTIGLIAINCAVFVLMAAFGVGIMEPSIDGLIKWGADFGPLTTHGQWWRLLTAVFVHVGLIHVAMNMYILWSIGSFTERLFGRMGFLVLYLLAGIGGSLTSLAWQPVLVSAGASGAVFGLYGGLLGYILRQRREIPPKRVTALIKNAGIFLAYNVVYGMARSQVDMAAHIGGFLSGLLLGFVLATPLLNVEESASRRKALITALAGTAIAALVLLRIPVIDDFRAELKVLGPFETASLKLFNESLDKLKKNEMTTAQFTEMVDKKLLPAWNAERDRLSKLHLPGRQAEINKMMVEYMSLRAEGWALMAKGIAADDMSLVQSANQKQAQAGEVINRMNTRKP